MSRSPRATQTGLQRTLLAKKLAKANEGLDASQLEPIAIVGMSCRFPGGANDPASYWELLSSGVDAVSEAPPERFRSALMSDPRIELPERIFGGFIDQVDGFDASFFRISPREAMALDPQHRLLLELAWEALEDAAIAPDSLKRSRTGVFVGMKAVDYKVLASHVCDFANIDFTVASGTSHCFASGRISYLLGLEGPSLTVETACSASLVSVDLACQSLRTQQSDLALCGGVELLLTEQNLIGGATEIVAAADGRCKAFDASADGMVRGEGGGLVLLKRLSDAIADGDHVRALIRGCAVNQDGRSAGITAPNGRAQERLIRDALRRAGVRAADVDFVECHGTGTPLGDPIELEALSAALGEERADGSRCALASVKTNIGHLESAAGIAGLIKAALCLEQRQLAPHLHFRQLTPHASFDGTPFYVPVKLEALPEGKEPLFAGVSSFGITGTNAHVVLEEYPKDLAGRLRPAADADAPPVLLPLSARSAPALTALAARYSHYLTRNRDVDLRSVARSAVAGRSHFEHRAAFVGRTPAELGSSLREYAAGELPRGFSQGHVESGSKPRVTLVFSGQDSQWPGMGRQLYQEDPAFKQALDECDDALAGLVDWRLIDELFRDEGASRLSRLEVAQPAIFAIQAALARVWLEAGVEISSVIGHSMGEVAAAHVCGALSLADAARVIAARARLGAALEGQGRMATVHLPFEEASRRIEPHGDRVWIAAEQSAETVVLGGEETLLRELVQELETERVHGQLLGVRAAGHGPTVDALLPSFERALASIRPGRASLPMRSSVSAEREEGHALTPDYWCRNVRRPVRFWSALRAEHALGSNVFVELSPHPVLYTAIEGGIRKAGLEAEALFSMREAADAEETLLEAFGRIYTLGGNPGHARSSRGARRAPGLPSYPWQRSKLWIDQHPAAVPGAEWRARPGSGSGRDDLHPLFSGHWRSSVEPEREFFEVRLDLRELPYLRDHRAGATVALPASVYLEIAAAIARRVGSSSSVVRDLVLSRPLVLLEETRRILQVSAYRARHDRVRLEFRSREELPDDREEPARWVEHGSAEVVADGEPLETDVPAPSPDLPDSGIVDVDAFYRRFESHGFAYGPDFRNVREARVAPGRATGRLKLREATAFQATRYWIHPALLDSALQLVSACTGGEESSPGGLYLPSAIEWLRIERAAADELVAEVRIAPSQEDGAIRADVDLWLPDGALCARIRGLGLRRFGAGDEQAEGRLLFESVWRPAPLGESDAGGDTGGDWLVFCDAGGTGLEIVRQARGLGIRCVPVYREGEVPPQAADEDGYRIDPLDDEAVRGVFDAEQAAGRGRFSAAVYLWGLDAAVPVDDPEDLFRVVNRTVLAGALHLVQGAARAARDAPRLWFVTRGRDGEPTRTQPAQAPLWGLARAVAVEHPELRASCFDLPPAQESGSLAALVGEVLRGGRESAVALRSGRRYVQRLLRRPQKGIAPVVSDAVGGELPYRLSSGEEHRIGALHLREVARVAPGEGEVEIRVEAGGLNFKDVLQVIGVIPGGDTPHAAIGNECSGVVERLGPGVQGLSVGDEVMGMIPGLGSFATTSARLVTRKPEHLGFREAAAIPIAFMTAHYALNHVARLRPGERVLIHSASGGVGLAGIQLARRAGAEVLATAGSEEKRDYLRRLGVRHVMDSRSLDFAQEVLAATGGMGVDVVLNSLTGPALMANLDVLAAQGRFLEIGVRDIYENRSLPLGAFKKCLSYHAIELAPMALQCPERLQQLLREVASMFESGELAAPPCTGHPVDDAPEAFSLMARARHIGKIVLDLGDRRVAVERDPDRRFAGAGGFLIVGGLGDLGLEFARWLAGRGAGAIVLMGRSGEVRAEVGAELDRLRASGVSVEVCRGDVAVAADVRRAVERVRSIGGHLRGVIHAAVHLEDGLMINQSMDRFERVGRSKILGACNLHQACRGEPVELFLLCSSVGTLLGSVGQASYTAANAFLESLAEQRRACGEAALAVAWGPWAQIGGAARAGVNETMSAVGIRPLQPAAAIRALDRLSRSGAGNVGVFDFEPERFFAAFPDAAARPYFSELEWSERADAIGASRAAVVREELIAIESAEERRVALVEYLRRVVADTLRLPLEDVDPKRPIVDFGMDSLSAIEVRNALERDLGIAGLTAASIIVHPTIEVLAPVLAGRCGIPVPAVPSEAGATPAEVRRGIARSRAEKRREALARRSAQAASRERERR